MVLNIHIVGMFVGIATGVIVVFFAQHKLEAIPAGRLRRTIRIGILVTLGLLGYQYPKLILIPFFLGIAAVIAAIAMTISDR